MKYLQIFAVTALSLATNLHAVNLVRDASFKAGPRLWFNETGQGNYHISRDLVPDAKDGRFVMAVHGWEKFGSVILSPPIPLAGTSFSATMDIRARGDNSDAKVELLLFDAEGQNELASFGEILPGAKWDTLAAAATLKAEEKEGRLGIRVSGRQKGVTLEVDRVGLFAGSKLEPVSDNGETFLIEASELADGKAWQAVSADGGDMYFDPAFTKTVLSGYGALPPDESGEVARTITIRQGGDYRLWVRFLQTSNMPGAFTVSLRQAGRVVAEKKLESSEGTGDPWLWRWDSLSARLEPGEAELVLSRPPEGAGGVSRRLDRFFLTNNTDYEVKDIDLRTPVYFRVTNRSEGVEPFCFWLFVRRHIGPDWYATPGMLSHGGFSLAYNLPVDPDKWLAPGESTPWVRLSDYLLPKGYNNVQMIATRLTHTEGFVRDRIQGEIEFAVGEERKIVKTVPFDQEAPRILFTLPAEPESGKDIRFGKDYLEAKETALRSVEPEAAVGANAKAAEPMRNIEISGHLSINDDMDDPALLEAEIGMMKRLGMNNTYGPVGTPENAKERSLELGLFPGFGVGDLATYHFLEAGGEAGLEEVVRAHAEALAPILDDVHRNMMADEPTAYSYEILTKSPDWTPKFQEWLRQEGVTPETLGVASWDAVTPVGPDKKELQPSMFYYTGLFRLHAMADFAKTAQAIYQKYYPATALATVNLSPTVFSGISNDEGHDEYLLFRNGGLGLMWTEDWGGYGASLQQLSSYLAMLRVAGRPDKTPLGGFLVPTGEPVTQRIKTYLWLQEGVKMLNLYAYGPSYAGIDSWSTRYEIYPELAKLGQEIRRLDPALDGVKRRPAQIAIVYNRTAGIWHDFAVNTEQDARYIHWALAHAGYDADIIPEEDIEADGLTAYRLLYLNGVQLRQEAAEKIADWVKGGGVLVGTAGAGTRDPFDRASEKLNEVFGVTSKKLLNVNSAGRPRYETRNLPNLGLAQSDGEGGVPKISYRTLGIMETLEPLPGASIILRRNGEPAGVLNTWGKGKAIRLSSLPGLAYLKEATEEDAPNLLPVNYRTELRDFIAWPAKLAGVQPVVTEKSEPLTTVTRWDHPERTILYVINYGGKPTPDFRMVIPDAAGFTTARTLQGKPVELKPVPGSPGALEIRFALDVADAVVLERLATPKSP